MTNMYLWIAIVLIFITIYFKVYKPIQKWKNLKVPHVKPLPIFGNLLSFFLRQKSLAEWVQDMYNALDTRYIGTYQLNIPGLMKKDVNLIKQIGIKDFDHFVDHRAFINEDIDPLFGKTLFVLTGQKWRRMRSTLSPAFTGSKMRSMFILMSNCAEEFTNYFKEQVNPNKPMTIEMKDIFTRYANDVIASCAFGITCNSMKDKENEFYLMGKDATNFGLKRFLKIFLSGISLKIMGLLGLKIIDENPSNFFRNIVSNNIKIREEQGIIRPDLIHLLMEARKGKLKHEDKVNDTDAGFATVEESDVGKDIQQARNDLSDDDITAQALLFFLAGFDTVSLVMCYMAYELALNEVVQFKLQEEIDEAFQAGNGKITYDIIIKMKYLDMVLSETLRKWPPTSGVDRICVDSYTIPAEKEGETPVTLQKGDGVWFPIYGLHRDEKYFPNPDKFDPERFSDENKGNIEQLAYIPFGVGPRNCIGSRFALLEAKVVFVYLLSKFSLVICEKSQVPLKLKKYQYNMTAENGFWLALKLRT